MRLLRKSWPQVPFARGGFPHRPWQRATSDAKDTRPPEGREPQHPLPAGQSTVQQACGGRGFRKPGGHPGSREHNQPQIHAPIKVKSRTAPTSPFPYTLNKVDVCEFFHCLGSPSSVTHHSPTRKHCLPLPGPQRTHRVSLLLFAFVHSSAL